MTEQELRDTIRDFKVEHIANIKKLMHHKGELLPMICVLVFDTPSDQPMVVVAPVVGDFSETGKNAVIDKVLPEIFERLKSEKKIPLCMSFSSEAWLRKVEGQEVPADWKSIEKVETLITTFETKEGSEIVCNLMKRTGQVVNEEGELIDRIELEDLDVGGSSGDHKLRGRFGDMFNRFGFSE